MTPAEPHTDTCRCGRPVRRVSGSGRTHARSMFCSDRCKRAFIAPLLENAAALLVNVGRRQYAKRKDTRP